MPAVKVYSLIDIIQVECGILLDFLLFAYYKVFQRRFNGNLDFSRNWIQYKFGFGDLDGDFWLGESSLLCWQRY